MPGPSLGDGADAREGSPPLSVSRNRLTVTCGAARCDQSYRCGTERAPRLHEPSPGRSLPCVRTTCQRWRTSGCSVMWAFCSGVARLPPPPRRPVPPNLRRADCQRSPSGTQPVIPRKAPMDANAALAAPCAELSLTVQRFAVGLPPSNKRSTSVRQRVRRCEVATPTMGVTA